VVLLAPVETSPVVVQISISPVLLLISHVVTSGRITSPVEILSHVVGAIMSPVLVVQPVITFHVLVGAIGVGELLLPIPANDRYA
jgi:hypothetical protein